jgi:hypothetical protein
MKETKRDPRPHLGQMRGIDSPHPSHKLTGSAEHNGMSLAGGSSWFQVAAGPTGHGTTNRSVAGIGSVWVGERPKHSFPLSFTFRRARVLSSDRVANGEEQNRQTSPSCDRRIPDLSLYSQRRLSQLQKLPALASHQPEWEWKHGSDFNGQSLQQRGSIVPPANTVLKSFVFRNRNMPPPKKRRCAAWLR